MMLSIQKPSHLARHLGTSCSHLADVLKSADDFYEEFWLLDPAKPKKRRTVINVRGELRGLQTRLYRSLLLPRLKPSPFSHGGVRKRSIKTNVLPHARSTFAFKTDISNFYPSIRSARVYSLLVDELGCSPDVARLCTRLCTYRYCLALGLVTSPVLADQVLKNVDRRIGGMCDKEGLIYTRFVDDITISGPFDFSGSGIPRLVERIVREDGLSVNAAKNVFGQLRDGTSITGLRTVKGRLDVTKEYAAELERQLDDAAALARADTFQGPYYTAGQILGRVYFVCWINPGRRHKLMRRFRSIKWKRVQQQARERGLIAAKKKLVPVSEGM